VYYQIRRRQAVEVNTDPQRRCYNGCHFSTKIYWTDWEVMESTVHETKVAEKLEFWRSLNKFAVSQRGPSAECQYEAIEEFVDAGSN